MAFAGPQEFRMQPTPTASPTTSAAAPPAQRLNFIAALKAVASQFIVLHHLAFYGPMSDIAYPLAPQLIKWFSDYGRLAVQVFFVIGGFLVARSVAARAALIGARPFAVLWERYLRLVVPLAVALLAAIAAAAIGRAWMPHVASVPPPPTLMQLAAHLLLLQDLLHIEALSAGIWYVAIDFQSFAMLVIIVWLAHRLGGSLNGTRRLTAVLACLLGGASLFFFNRDPDWDNAALYFFGSYALGVIAFWLSDRARSALWLAALAAAASAALLLDFRIRIAIAVATALVLVAASRGAVPGNWPKHRVWAFLGQISYSVFLIHYPVCLIVNAVFFRFAPQSPLANALGMLLAWAASIAAGSVLFQLVERHVARAAGTR